MAFEELMEGFKSFPAGKVKAKRDKKPDTVRGIMAQRAMDVARIAHTHELTKDEAKGAVKEREMDNRKRGLEKIYNKKDNVAVEDKNKKKDGTQKGNEANKDLEVAYKEEGKRRKELDKHMKKKAKGYPSIEEHYNSLADAYEQVLRKMHGG